MEETQVGYLQQYSTMGQILSQAFGKATGAGNSPSQGPSRASRELPGEEAIPKTAAQAVAMFNNLFK